MFFKCRQKKILPFSAFSQIWSRIWCQDQINSRIFSIFSHKFILHEINNFNTSYLNMHDADKALISSWFKLQPKWHQLSLIIQILLSFHLIPNNYWRYFAQQVTVLYPDNYTYVGELQPGISGKHQSPVIKHLMTNQWQDNQ